MVIIVRDESLKSKTIRGLASHNKQLGSEDSQKTSNISILRDHVFSFRPMTYVPHVFPECAYPVGIERGMVPNEAFSASSWYDVDHEPWLARLYSREGEGAWCALENDGTQYLQIDLAQIHIITGVATQGKYEISEWAIRFRAWVTNFSLSFTDDHMLWVNYTEDGVSPKVSFAKKLRFKIAYENHIGQIISCSLSQNFESLIRMIYFPASKIAIPV